MDAYSQALLLDIPVVLICTALLVFVGGLRFAHPATPYLVFHIHTVTTRLFGLLTGGTTLFSYPVWRGNYFPVQPEEIQRAALYSDVVLITMTAVWLWLGRRSKRALVAESRAQRAVPASMLNEQIVRTVIAVSFVIGIIGLIIGAQIPGFGVNERLAQFGEWGSSSYLLIIQMWSGLALLAYFYVNGFRPKAVALFVLFLLIMAYQGYHRFRVVIPLLLAVQIWLDRRDRPWPPWRMTLLLAAGAVAFFPLKIIGVMAREGSGLSAIAEEVTSAMTAVAAGTAPDQMFLDQMASALTLLDIQGRMYLGSMYLPLLTLPIPRQFWPDKPGLATFLVEVSIPERPMSQNGMIATFIGESYANLGQLGIVVVPALFAIGLTVFYAQAYRRDFGSVVRFAYALVSVNLIQVYRDGLVSLVTFTFVNMMPLTAIVLAHMAEAFLKRHKQSFGYSRSR